MKEDSPKRERPTLTQDPPLSMWGRSQDVPSEQQGQGFCRGSRSPGLAATPNFDTFSGENLMLHETAAPKAMEDAGIQVFSAG